MSTGNPFAENPVTDPEDRAAVNDVLNAKGGGRKTAEVTAETKRGYGLSVP